MEFEELLQLVGDEPLFESALLLAGEVSPANLRLQLTRWKNAGRIYQLRRGLYSLAPPYQKVKTHPFVVANHLVKASYVSCQSALGFYGVIPEQVHQTTSVTGGRPGSWETQLGSYRFQHIKPALLRGYLQIEMTDGQQALVAHPEKALLDLVYLQPQGDAPEYLDELRLQNLDRLDLEELQRQAILFNTPKLYRAVTRIQALIQSEHEYETL
jgi:predicted transcriptional regulator of viral defense system